MPRNRLLTSKKWQPTDQDFDLEDFDQEGFDIGGGEGGTPFEEEKF